MTGWTRMLLAFAALAVSGQAVAADSFRDFQIAYRCEVVRRLEVIYAAGDPAISRDRFIAITLPDTHRNYVQCLFQEGNRKIYCEASSGFWLSKKGEARTVYQPPATVAALSDLGFDTDDSEGNFSIERDIGAQPNFNALADFILRALHDGYGARSTTALKFNAPFAPNTPTSCVPVG